jgi:hypothetical protein
VRRIRDTSASCFGEATVSPEFYEVIDDVDVSDETFARTRCLFADRAVTAVLWVVGTNVS